MPAANREARNCSVVSAPTARARTLLAFFGIPCAVRTVPIEPTRLPNRFSTSRDRTMTGFDPKRRDMLKLTAATSGALAAAPFLPGAAPPAAAQDAKAAAVPLNNVV